MGGRLTETGFNGIEGVGSGRNVGGGGVAGLVILDASSPSNVSTSASSSSSQKEDGSGFVMLLILVFPSSAARASTRFDNLTEGLMNVEEVKAVIFEDFLR